MSFKDLELGSTYNSSRNDLIEDFYIPVLSEAKSYDRVTGYFDSDSFRRKQHNESNGDTLFKIIKNHQFTTNQNVIKNKIKHIIAGISKKATRKINRKK